MDNTRQLTKEQIETYHRDGLLHLPNFFDSVELEPLRRATREDPTINGSPQVGRRRFEEMYGFGDFDESSC